MGSVDVHRARHFLRHEGARAAMPAGGVLCCSACGQKVNLHASCCGSPHFGRRRRGRPAALAALSALVTPPKRLEVCARILGRRTNRRANKCRARHAFVGGHCRPRGRPGEARLAGTGGLTEGASDVSAQRGASPSRAQQPTALGASPASQRC